MTESESEEQDASISSDSIYESVAYDSGKTRLLESEVKAEEATNQKSWNRTL